MTNWSIQKYKTFHNKSFNIRDPPTNILEDEVEASDEAKDKIEAEVIISCTR